MNAPRALLVGLLTLQAAIFGCSSGEDGPRKYRVTGEVTFDGAPMPVADILFVPQDTTLASEAGTIQDGKYEAHVTAGLQTVTIQATREVPGQTLRNASGDLISMRESYVPERYNTKSVLSVEIAENNQNKHDFHLTEKPAAN